jgi:hypothetical protein
VRRAESAAKRHLREAMESGMLAGITVRVCGAVARDEDVCWVGVVVNPVYERFALFISR